MPHDPKYVQALFLQAVEFPAGDRGSFLDRECSGNQDLRQRIEALLAAHDAAGSFLEPPVDAGTAAFQQDATPDIGVLFAGRYKLREKLGEGGMGVVYVADQSEPVQRRVALKVIKVGADSARLLARFEQERQALALMDHPNIAKVFDAGIASESGVPYFVMELIKGMPITAYCDQAKLTTKQRLELFIPVCQAVQHAHQKGIIHRDLKPSNILVGLYDSKPVPKVIDFGVAKATGSRLTDQSIYTEVGALIGTLEYMSPEQAELNNLDIDTRSDIYALGVILYELLTGSVPFSRKDLQSAGFAEMLRIIKEQEPPKPSTKLSGSGTLPSIAAVRQIEPKKLTRMMRGELDWIVMKCLEKDRGRRYETANQLGIEIQRYLADEPILAGPPSAAYRLRKFVRRNQVVVAASTIVVAALLIGAIGATIGLLQARSARIETEKALAQVTEEQQSTKAALDAEARESARARHAETEASEEAANSKSMADFLLNDLLGQLNAHQALFVAPDPDMKLRTVVDRAAKRAQGRFKDRPRVEGSVQRSLGWIYISLGAYAEAQTHLARTWQVCRDTFGDHEDTWVAQFELAIATQQDGKHEVSERMHLEALAGLRRLKGEKHSDVLTIKSGLATLYLDSGRAEKAQPLLDEVLSATANAEAGSIDRKTHLFALMPRAQIEFESGRSQQAIERMTEAYEGLRLEMGENNPFTLVAAANLGGIWLALGRFAEAEKTLASALALAKKSLGDEHPTTALLMNNLGSVYLTRDEIDRAEELQVKAVEVLKRKNPNHHETLLARQNVAVILQRRNKLAEAHEEFASLFETCRQVLNPGHPTTLRVQVNLAFVKAARNTPDAAAFYEQTLLDCKKDLPAAHPVTINVLYEYGRLLRGLKKLNHAASISRQGYELARNAYGPDALQTQDALRELVEIYAVQKRPDLIEPLMVERVASMKRLHGDKSDEYVVAISVLGVTRVDAKMFVEAEGPLREGLRLREKDAVRGLGWHTVASALGESLAGQKKYKEAEPFLVDSYRALKQIEKSIPPHARRYRIDSVRRLAELYEATERKTEAQSLRKELEQLVDSKEQRRN